MVKLFDINGEFPVNAHFDVFSAMKYVPRQQRLAVEKRRCSTFMFVINGHYRYCLGTEYTDVCEKSLLYIPKGISYEYEVISKLSETECIQVEFDIIDSMTGDSYVFESTPTVSQNPHDSYKYLSCVLDCLCDRQNDALMYGSMFMLLSRFHSFGKEAGKYGAMLPALEYIRNNYTEKIKVSELARLCFLSEAQFRRRFKGELGISPVQYREKLLINAAKNMLLADNASIGDIADRLGFPSLYTFSRTFKLKTGVSPTAYIKEKR